MQVEEVSILEDSIVNQTVRRRKLLPLWIKIFVWLFMLTGVFTPVIVAIGLTGGQASLALFGLETNEPLSFIGLFISFMFLFKGIAAFGLWTEKVWAISVAKVDAIVSIAICTAVKLLLPAFNADYNFVVPIELALLIPYFLKLRKIETSWAMAYCG